MAKKSRRSVKTGVPRALEQSGSLALAFANTAAPTRDDRRRDPRVVPAAPTYGGLVTWLVRMGALPAADGERLRVAAAARPRDASAALAGADELRFAVLRIFTALALGREASAADLAILNRCRRACHIGPEADGFGWLWPGEDETLARVLWPPAQSAAELLASGDYRRVRQCACQGCYRLFLYQNSRRLWCDPNTCGNRAKGRRHAQSWRRVRKQQEHERLVDSARRIEEFRQWCAEQGKVADFDKEDPEFGVWSDGWGEKLKKELKSRAE